MGRDGPGRSYNLPGSFCHGQPNGINKATALVHFFCNSFSLYKSGISDCCVTRWKCPSHHCYTQPMETTALGPSGSPAHHYETPPPIIPLLSDIPLIGTPPVGHPFAEVLAASAQKKQDCFSSGSLNLHGSKRACVNSQEVKAGSDHSSTQGNDSTPYPIHEARPSSQQREQEPDSSPSYLTRTLVDPDDETAAKSLWSTGDQASLDSYSVQDNAEGWQGHSLWQLCLMLRHRGAHIRYWKRIWASCGLGRSSLWMEMQLKRIREVPGSVGTQPQMC